MPVLLSEEIVPTADWPSFTGLLLRDSGCGVNICEVAGAGTVDCEEEMADAGGNRDILLRRWGVAEDSGLEEGGRADTWAWVLPLNPLDEVDADRIVDVINVVEPGTRLVVWSGTMGDELFETAPANWLGAGFEALSSFAQRVRNDLISRGVRLLFLPHARHVLSDGPVCLQFMREQSEAAEGAPVEQFNMKGCPLGIALSPVLLMEPSMVADSEDHIRRIMEVVGPIAEAVIFEDGVVDVERDRIVVGGYDGDGGDAACGPVWVVDWEKVRGYLQEMSWSGVIVDKR